MFIVIDGIDGSGKSTQAQLLADFLQTKQSKEVVLSREPGGSSIAEKIRKLLFLPELNDHLTELLLYLAARRDHLLQKIKPALADNKIIICDRFIYSTIAYQGYGFGIDIKLINEIHKAIIPRTLLPQITFILNLNVEIALARTKQATQTKYEDKFNQDFFNRVNNGFIELSKAKNCHLINGNSDVEEVHNNIKSHCLSLI